MAGPGGWGAVWLEGARAGSLWEARATGFAAGSSAQLGGRRASAPASSQGPGTPEQWPREGGAPAGWAPDGTSSHRGCITFSGPYPWANFTVLAVGVWAVAQRDSIDAISLVRRGKWEVTGLRGRGPPSHPIPPIPSQSCLFLTPPPAPDSQVSHPACLALRAQSPLWLPRQKHGWGPPGAPASRSSGALEHMPSNPPPQGGVRPGAPPTGSSSPS